MTALSCSASLHSASTTLTPRSSTTRRGGRPVEYLCGVVHAQAHWLGWLRPGELSWEIANWRARVGVNEAASDVALSDTGAAPIRESVQRGDCMLGAWGGGIHR